MQAVMAGLVQAIHILAAAQVERRGCLVVTRGGMRSSGLRLSGQRRRWILSGPVISLQKRPTKKWNTSDKARTI